MSKYKPSDNFDILVAFGSCLAIDYYLTCKYLTPNSFSQKEEQEYEKQPSRRNKFFTSKRRSVFSGRSRRS